MTPIDVCVAIFAERGKTPAYDWNMHTGHRDARQLHVLCILTGRGLWSATAIFGVHMAQPVRTCSDLSV